MRSSSSSGRGRSTAMRGFTSGLPSSIARLISASRPSSTAINPIVIKCKSLIFWRGEYRSRA